MAITTVLRGLRSLGPARRDTRTMTPIIRRVFRDTFLRPSVGDGETRREMWAASSADGRWSYVRQDDGIGTLWTVTFLPTGQSRQGYGTSDAARRDTASTLLGELRAEAFVAALRGPFEDRGQGQRWLAVHMRLVGADEATARCLCGGLLVRATRAGDWAHVDGCGECYQHGAGLRATCEQAAGHLFCAAPIPIECSHWWDRPRVCGELAAPNDGAGCGLGKTGDCCTLCCHGE